MKKLLILLSIIPALALGGVTITHPGGETNNFAGPVNITGTISLGTATITGLVNGNLDFSGTGYNSGAQWSYDAGGHDGSITWGSGATGSYDSIVIGTGADSTSAAVAVGRTAHGGLYGVAVGCGASAADFGTSFGFEATSDNYNIAVGFAQTVTPGLGITNTVSLGNGYSTTLSNVLVFQQDPVAWFDVMFGHSYPLMGAYTAAEINMAASPPPGALALITSILPTLPVFYEPISTNWTAFITQNGGTIDGGDLAVGTSGNTTTLTTSGNVLFDGTGHVGWDIPTTLPTIKGVDGGGGQGAIFFGSNGGYGAGTGSPIYINCYASTLTAVGVTFYPSGGITWYNGGGSLTANNTNPYEVTYAGSSNILGINQTAVTIYNRLVLPNMTKSARDALTSVASGTVIFQTDNTAGMRCYNGSHWVRYTETND